MRELVDKICAECGSEFSTRRKDQVYCWTECEVRVKLKEIDGMESVKCAYVKCDKTFKWSRSDKRYCSKKCAQKAKGKIDASV